MTLSLLTVCFALSLGTGVLPGSSVPHGDSGDMVLQNIGSSKGHGTFIADMKTNRTTEKEKQDGPSTKIPSETNPEAQKTKEGGQSSSRPESLKRFVPSEKIEADQAVDFPHDI